MKNALPMIVITAMVMCYVNGSARADDSSTSHDAISIRSLLTANDLVFQKQSAKWILDSFDLAKYEPQSSLMSEFYSVIDDPVLGYSNGCRLAEIFSATVEKGTMDTGPVGPIQDVSSKFDNLSKGLVPRIHALDFRLNLSGHMDLQMPDTLFLYWKGNVFRILNQAFIGASLIDNRYVVSRVVRVDPQGITRLELWSLDTQAKSMHRILNVVIDKWVSHGGNYYEMEVPVWDTLGRSFEPVEAYYREDIPKSPGVCTDGGLYSEPRSPYFIHYSYKYDPKNSVFAESGGETLKGEQFLITLSKLVDTGAPVDARTLLRDYFMFDPDPIITMQKAFPKLSDAVQVDAILLLQELTDIVCGPDQCADRFFGELQATATKWKSHYETAKCNFPWKP